MKNSAAMNILNMYPTANVQEFLLDIHTWFLSNVVIFADISSVDCYLIVV